MKGLRRVVLIWLMGVATACAAEPPSMFFVMQFFPPFIYGSTDQPIGAFPETLQAVCAKLQAQCKLSIFPWRRAYAMAESGTADGLLLLLKTRQRENDFFLTSAVFQSAYVMYVQQQNTVRYSGPTDLTGYTVAAYGPSGTSVAADELTQRAPDTRLIVEIDNQTALRKLRQGRYGTKGLVVINRDLAQFLLHQDAQAGLRVVGELQNTEYHIGLSRRRMSQEQADKFNAALRQLQQDGTINAIAQKYGLKAAPPN